MPDTATPNDRTKPRASGGARVAMIVLMNWSRYAVMLGVSLVMTPMLLGAMRIDLFGLYMFFNLVRFALQDLTQPLLTRELAAAWASDKPDVRRRAFSSAAAVSLLAAVIAAVLGWLAVQFGAGLLNTPEGSLPTVRLMIGCEAAMLVMMLGAAPSINLFMASHRVVENNFHRTFERLGDLVVAIPVIYLLHVDVVRWYVVGRVVFRAVHVGVCVVRARMLERDARAALASVDRELVGHYSDAMKWSASLPISNQFYWYIDQVLLNLFFGAVFNGVYGIINQLRGYARILGGGLFMGAEGMTADMHERGQHDFTRRLMLTAMRSSVAITAICTVLVAGFVGPLMYAWLGAKLETDQALKDAGVSVQEVVSIVWCFFLIMAPAIPVIEGGCSAITILFGVGRLRQFAPALLVMTLMKLLLTWLALWMAVGHWGRGSIQLAAWVTSITSIAMYGVYLPFLVKRAMGIGVMEQYRRVYLWPLVSVLPIGALAWAMATYLGPWPHGAVSMIKLAACAGVAGVAWLPLAVVLIPEEYERQRVIGMLERIGGRIPGMGMPVGMLRRAWKV